MSDTPATTLRDAERWFYRRGLPFFVVDYRSSTDVWTRASPFLAVAFIALVLGAAATFDTALDAVGGLVALVLLVALYGLLNRRRGRPAWALPERVTWPVLAAFVVVPGALELLTGSSPLDALDTMALAVVVLLVTWIVTRYAILPVIAWAVRYTARGMNDLSRLATRALPLLLLVITFLFINTEVWQVAGSLNAGHLWLAIALFVVLGIVVVVSRVPEEVRLIEAATTRQQVVDACRGTPLEGGLDDLPGLDTPIALSRRQRANLGLVMTVAQLVQVALFAVIVWVFFVVFGALAISLVVQQAWLAQVADVQVLWSWSPGYGITRPLLRVSLFLAAFSGFYVTIYTGVDATYREHIYDRIRRDLERSLSVRRAYIRLIESS